MQNRITHLEDELKQFQEKEASYYESSVTFNQMSDVDNLKGKNIQLNS